MITNRESLKAKLRNLSDKTNIASNYAYVTKVGNEYY